MKILVVAPYFYSSCDSRFQKNNSGLGVVIGALCEELGKEYDVSILINRFTKKVKHGSFVVEKHSFWQFISCIKLKYMFEAIKIFFKNKDSFVNRLHVLFQCLNQGYIEKQIKKNRPSLVHIHSVCINSSLTSFYCEKKNIPFILTLHGIISNDSVEASKYFKDEEGRICKYVSKSKNGLITCVSSCTSSRLVDKYHLEPSKVITTVNGIEDDILKIIDTKPTDICNLNNKFTIICSGNISKNKNQFQLLESLKMLPYNYFEKIIVLLVGENLDSRINEFCYNNKNIDVKVVGFVNRKELFSYYKNSNLNVLLSHSEGFGMSVIEGYLCGVPSLFFSDIDAASDLYNEDCSISLEDRSNSTVAIALMKAMDKKWNKEKIINFGKKFLLSNTILNYKKAIINCVKKSGGEV